MKKYVPMHVHSTYSIGDGVAKVEDIVTKAKQVGAPGVSITEHGNMLSYLKHYKAAKKDGLNPILGCEFYINDRYFFDKENKKQEKKTKFGDLLDFLEDLEDEEEIEIDKDYVFVKDDKTCHLVAYAKNIKGLENIIRLSNTSFNNYHYKPLISTPLLFEYLDENNIITTACLGSQFSRLFSEERLTEAEDLLLKYNDKFKGNFYTEIFLNGLPEQKAQNEFYYKMWKKHNIQPLFSLDSHYVNKEDYIYQYYLYLIKSKASILTMPYDKWFYPLDNLYIKTPAELYELREREDLDLEFFELSLDNTLLVNSQVNIEIKFYQENYPKFYDTFEESKEHLIKTAKQKFVEKVKVGLIPKDQIDVYKERLKYELDIIIEKKFIDYFLILDDLLNNFVYKVGGSTGAGRGSAGGSLLLFILDITKIDPVKYNLIFERFINPGRIDPPDVDLDIDSITHKKVEEYLKGRWGEDKVCHIINFLRMGNKTVVKDICRVMKLDFIQSNELSKLLGEFDGTIEDNLDNAIKTTNSELLKEFIRENKDLFTETNKIFKDTIRQTGRHASGILISNKSLKDSAIPVYKVGDELVTGLQEGGSEREVGEMGYLKLDILGLTTATINNKTFADIKAKYNLKGNIEQQIILSDFSDVKVWDEFCKGLTEDIFQFGSDAMISFIKRAQPRHIYDLCAINAAWRPAVIAAGGVEEYLNNKQNPEEVAENLKRIHIEYYNILKETHGVPIYQEQIMFILQKLGGFTLTEADKTRKVLKVIGNLKDKNSPEFAKLLKQFGEGCEKNNISKKDTEHILEIMAQYSNYAFNKCLSGNTMVQTKTGLRKISEFKPGMEVVCYHPTKHYQYNAKVKELHLNGVKNVYQIKTNEGEIVKCTLNHKFLTSSGMISLQEILDRELNIISAYKNKTFFIKESLTFLGPQETYDLEIDDENHNFLIGRTGVVTSNSHSFSYSVNAFISMWLKVYYPLEYYKNLLNYSSFNDNANYIKNILNQGVKFEEFSTKALRESFDINYENKTLYFGLSNIKGFSTNDIEVLKKINVHNIYELIHFLKVNKISKKNIELLSRLGFFKEFEKNNRKVEKVVFEALALKKLDQCSINKIMYDNRDLPDYTEKDDTSFKKQYLNVFLGEHPLVGLYERIKVTFAHLNIQRIASLDKMEEGRVFGIVGLVIDSEVKTTKTNKKYMNVKVEDETAICEVTFWDSSDTQRFGLCERLFVECVKHRGRIVKKGGYKIF